MRWLLNPPEYNAHIPSDYKNIFCSRHQCMMHLLLRRTLVLLIVTATDLTILYSPC